MEQDIKREAFRQYFRYFRFWFLAVGLSLAALLGIWAAKTVLRPDRGNKEAPAERVYDRADVLTKEEEDRLRRYIAKQERKHGIDIVLVTISENVEALGDWETVMMEYADNFYDDMKYGYNRVHGDGVLLLDNWYEGQEGSWLSTCGRVLDRFGNYEIDTVLDAVYEEVEESPYRAYRAYVKEIGRSFGGGSPLIPPEIVLLFPIVMAAVYASMHSKQKKAEDTAGATAFVENGRPVVKDSRDSFIRKNLVTTRIQTSSGSGGRSGGGGGSHRSSGGVRHGGGGRRR